MANGLPNIEELKKKSLPSKTGLKKKEPTQPTTESTVSPSTTAQGGSSLESPSVQPKRDFNKIRQEAFGEYLTEALQDGKISEDDATLKPSDVFRAAATNQPEANLPSSFNDLNNEPQIEWGATEFYQDPNDAVQAEKNKEKASIKEESKKVTDKIRQKVLATIPKEENNPEGIAKLEEELLNEGIRVNLNPEDSGVIGEDEGWYSDAGLSTQKGFENAALSVIANMGGTSSFNATIAPLAEFKRNEEMTRLTNKITQFDGDILDKLNEGNLSEATRLSLNQTGESLPMMGLAIGGATIHPALGYGLIAELAAGQRYLDIKKEAWAKDLSPVEMTAYLAVYGGAEAFGEMVGGRVLKRSITNVLSKNEAIKGNAIKYLKDFFTAQAKFTGENIKEETIGEGITGVTQYVADAMAQGQEVTLDGTWDAFKRSAVSGLGGAGVMSTTSTTAKGVSVLAVTALSPKTKVLNKEANKLKDAMDEAQSPQELTVLAEELQRVEAAKNEVAKTKTAMFEAMDEAEQESYSRDLVELNKRLETIKELPEGGLAYETTKAIIEKLNNKIVETEKKYEGVKPKAQITEETTEEDSFDFTEDELGDLEREVAKEERITRDRTQPNRKPRDKGIKEPDAEKKVSAMEMLGKKVQDKDGVIGTIKEEGGSLIWESEDGTKVRESGGLENPTLQDMQLDVIPDSPTEPIALNQGEQAPLDKTNNQAKAEMAKLEEMNEAEFKEAVAQSEREVAKMETDLLKQAEKESRNERLIFKVGEDSMAVTQKADGTYLVSQKNANGKYVGIKDKAQREAAINEYNTLKEGRDSQRLDDAVQLTEEFQKEQDDKVLGVLDKLINATSSQGRAFDATLGIPMFVANSSLKIVRATYKGGKSLAEAIQEGIAHIKKQGHKVNETAYKKYVLNESKKPKPISKPKAPTQKPTPPKASQAKPKAPAQSQQTISQSIANAITNPSTKTVKERIKEVFAKYKVNVPLVKVKAITKRAVSITTQGQLDDFIDYVDKVLNNQNYLKDVRLAKALQSATKKLVKNANLLISNPRELNSLSINVEKLSIEDLSQYIELLNDLKKKNINIEDKNLQEVIEKFASLYEKKESKAKKEKSDEIIKDEKELRGIILDVLKGVSNEEISSIDVALMSSVNQVRNITSENLEGLSKADLGKLSIAINRLFNNLIPSNEGYEVIRKVAARKGSKKIVATVKGSKFRNLLRDIINPIKSTKREAFKKYLDFTVMNRVDNAIIGGLKKNGRAIYENIIEPISSAFSVYQGEQVSIEDRINSHIGRGKNKISKGKDLTVASAKLAIIGLAKQKAKNPDADNLSNIEEYIKTIKEDGGKYNEYKDKAKLYIEVYDSMMDGKNSFDWQEQYDALSQAEKNLFDEIESVMLDNARKSEIASIQNGEGVVIYEYYNPIRVVINTKSNLTDIKNDANRFAGEGNIPQAANLNNRTGSDGKLIHLDLVDNAISASRGVLRSFHLREAIKTVKATLEQSKEKSENDSLDFLNAVEDNINSTTESIFINTELNISKAQEAGNFLDRMGYARDLLSASKALSEVFWNAVHAFIFVGPSRLAVGMNVLRKNSVEDVATMYRLAGGTQFSRLFQKQGSARVESSGIVKRAGNTIEQMMGFFSEYLISKPDSSIARVAMAGVFKTEFEKLTGEKLDVANFQKQSKVFAKEVRQARLAADNVISQSFATMNPYEGITAARVDENDGNIKKANKYMTRFQMSEFQSMVDAINAMQGKGEISRAEGRRLAVATFARMAGYNLTLQYGNVILINLMTSLISSMTGNEPPEQDEEFTLENFKRDGIKAALGTAVSLVFFRRLQNIARVPIAVGVELLNSNYAQDFLAREDSRGNKEDYNYFKDGLAYSPYITAMGFGRDYKDPVKVGIDVVASLTGPKNKMTKGLANFVYYQTKAGIEMPTEELKKLTGKDNIDVSLLNVKRLKTRSGREDAQIKAYVALADVVASPTVPLTRDWMKLINEYVYDETRNK